MGAKYDQLDLDERIEMSRLYEAGTSRREIGRIIGRSASTVGRELRRNTLPRGGYKPASADRIASSRRRRRPSRSPVGSGGDRCSERPAGGQTRSLSSASVQSLSSAAKSSDAGDGAP